MTHRPMLIPSEHDYSPAFGMGCNGGQMDAALTDLQVRWERQWGHWSALSLDAKQRGFNTLPMLDVTGILRAHNYGVTSADYLAAATAARDAQSGQPMHYYLLGNEPNINSICPESYCDAYRAAYEACVMADPTGPRYIIGPSILGWTQTLTSGVPHCPTPTQHGADWFRVFVETYRARYGEIPMDACDLHLYVPYPAPDTGFAAILGNPAQQADEWVRRFEEDIFGYRCRMNVYPELANKDLWITEFGITHAWTGYRAGNPRDTDDRLLAFGTRLLRGAVEMFVRVHQPYRVLRWFPYVYSMGPGGWWGEPKQASFPMRFRGNAWADSEEPAPETGGHVREGIYGTLYRRLSSGFGHEPHENAWAAIHAPIAELIPYEGTVTYEAGWLDTYRRVPGQVPRFRAHVADADTDLTRWEAYWAPATEGPTDDWRLLTAGDVAPCGAVSFDVELPGPPGAYFLMVNAHDAAGFRSTGNISRGEAYLNAHGWVFAGGSSVVEVRL